ncbi:MAG: hypothetical protein IJX32_03865 [Spirochaetaceae bacterium]|nr:hypothetical protein [Spirochaetaceae bacterium]
MIKQNKKIALIIILSVFSFSLFATNVNYGIAYDNYDSKTFGFFGGISSSLTKKVDLSAVLNYYGGNNYRAFVGAEYTPFTFSTFSGGFSLAIQDKVLIPELNTFISFFTPSFFKINLKAILGLNPENLLSSSNYLVGSDLFFTGVNSTLNFNLEYQQKSKDLKKINFDTKVLAFDKQSPIQIGLSFYSQTILDSLAEKPFNIIFDLGFSTGYTKSNSTTTVALKTRVFNLRNSDSNPFILSIEKKVTF